MNASVPFNVLDYKPAIGQVFVFYVQMSPPNEKVTLVQATSYETLQKVPSDSSYVFDGATMLPRGNCPLKLESQTGYPSDQRKANLRLAELAVCEAFHGNPCAGSDKACKVVINAPLPYSSDQEKYIAAGMALVAHSQLCADRKSDDWAKEACKIDVSRAGISAGLVHTASGIKLRPIPGCLVDMKLDACYELRFRETVFAAPNKDDYADSTHAKTKHDVLAWQHDPPEATFCSDLSCLINKFER